MKIETKRLEIIPLTARELKLWLNNLPLLEAELNCTYKADSLEGFFGRIVQNQYEITNKDEKNYMFHTFWFIIRKEDRTVIGSSDFKDLPNEKGEVEIGYGLTKPFEHNGYMTECVQAMCDWAFNQENLNSVIAETECDNTASQNVLKRCNFKQYKQEKTMWWKITK